MTDDSAQLVDLSVAVAQKRKSKGLAARTTSDDATEPLGDPFAKLPAPPLPRGLMPPVIEAFAEREAATKGVAMHGPAMAALVVCAGAIPDTVRVKVKLYEPWYESARLWLALIGPPSAKKSPVIRAAMAPLKHLEKVEFARWRKVKASSRVDLAISADLDALILQCLKKAPEDRPQKALEIATKLARLQDGSPWTNEVAATWWERHRSASERRPGDE